MEFLSLLIGSAFGAFIGYSANRLAIWMLFHPRNPVKIGPLVIQGVFPKRKEEIAENMAKIVEENIISSDDVKAMVSDALERRLRYLELPIPLPSIARELLESTLKKTAISVVSKILDEMRGEMSVKEFVVKKFEEISNEEFEKMFLNAVGKELKYISLNDAAIGALVGALEIGILGLLH